MRLHGTMLSLSISMEARSTLTGAPSPLVLRLGAKLAANGATAPAVAMAAPPREAIVIKRLRLLLVSCSAKTDRFPLLCDKQSQAQPTIYLCYCRMPVTHNDGDCSLQLDRFKTMNFLPDVFLDTSPSALIEEPLVSSTFVLKILSSAVVTAPSSRSVRNLSPDCSL